MIDQKGQAPTSTVKLLILDSLNSNLDPPVVVNNLTRVIETCPHDLYRLIDIGYSVWDHAHLSMIITKSTIL